MILANSGLMIIRHCPAGVAEPTSPPALVTPTESVASAITRASSQSHDDDDDDDHDHAVSASTCEPHNDHWHCPSGVAQPSTRPAAASATTTQNSASATGASASPSSSQTPGVAAKVGTGALAIAGAVGAWLL